VLSLTVWRLEIRLWATEPSRRQEFFDGRGVAVRRPGCNLRWELEKCSSRNNYHCLSRSGRWRTYTTSSRGGSGTRRPRFAQVALTGKPARRGTARGIWCIRAPYLSQRTTHSPCADLWSKLCAANSRKGQGGLPIGRPPDRFYTCLYLQNRFLFTQQPIHENEQAVIEEQEPRRRPGETVEFPAEKRPEDRRREECIWVRRDVHDDVQKPAAHFPHRSAHQGPRKKKYQYENYRAVAEII